MITSLSYNFQSTLSHFGWGFFISGKLKVIRIHLLFLCLFLCCGCQYECGFSPSKQYTPPLW